MIYAAENDEIFTLGPYLLVGLIAVGLLLLVAVPALYYMAARKPVSPLGSCYLEGPRKVTVTVPVKGECLTGIVSL